MTTDESRTRTLSGIPQVLGVRVRLGPAEWLQTAISRWAYEMRSSRGELLDFFGLRGLPHNELISLGNHAQEDVIDRIAASTRLATGALRGSLMSSLNGKALIIDDTTERAAHNIARRSPLARLAGTRYCPACLREQPRVYNLTWRLNWSFICPTHSCLLRDTCPDCGRTPTDDRSKTTRSFDPDTCRNRLDPSSRFSFCGFPYPEDIVEPVDPDGRPAKAQRLILDQIASPDGALELLNNLRSIGAALRATGNTGRIAHLASVEAAELEGMIDHEEHPGTTAPLDAFAMSALTAAAVEILHAPDEISAEHIRLTTFERPVGYAPASVHLGPGSARDLIAHYPGAQQSTTLRRAILRAHDRDLSTTQRIVWGTTLTRAVRDKYPELAKPTSVEWLARNSPRNLWPSWTARFDRDSETSEEALARALRFVLLHTDSWEHADLSRGPRHLGQVRNRGIPPALGKGHALTQRLAGIGQLRLAMEASPSPIDYYARTRFPLQQLLTPAAWKLVADRAGVPAGGRLELACARWYLSNRVTGVREPGRGAPTTAGSGEAYTTFRLSMTRELQRELDAHAGAVLHSLGLRGPVTWSPPLIELPLGSPGRELNDINLALLHELLRSGERQQRVLASELGVSARRVLWAVDECPPGAQ
ncbi:MAG: hypothetical protein K0S37_136 [Microbacterium sp.]|nr:hypothetical protein [Microbacterium sp.]